MEHVILNWILPQENNSTQRTILSIIVIILKIIVISATMENGKLEDAVFS